MRKVVISLLLILALVVPAGATTLTSMTATVRALLYETETSNTIYTDAQITDAINEATFFLLDVLPYSGNYNMLNTAAVTLTSGRNTYSLPTGFRVYVSGTYKGTAMIQLKPEEVYSKPRQANTKDPFFTIINSQIVLYPTPTTGDTCEILFMKAPTVLSSGSDTISLFTEYDRLLALKAVMYLLSWDNQPARITTIEKELNTLLQVKIQAILNKNISGEIKKVPNGQ